MTQQEINTKIRQWLQGDDSAFECIFHQYYPRITAYYHKYMQDHTFSEDMTMEVLVKVWRNRHVIRTASLFENYLFTIARNHLINAWRKKIDTLLSLDTASGYADARETDTLLYKELETAYKQGLSVLPEQRRRIFLMHREENLSYREIAARLHISPKTVENQISATLKLLRTRLAEHLTSILL